MLTGSGWGTSPQQCIWFCHLCMSTFVLDAGERHECKPKPAAQLEVTEDMMCAAVDAYYEGALPTCESEFEDALREAITAALAVASSENHRPLED